MSDRPSPGDYDSAELLRAVENLLAEARRTSWDSAYLHALEADVASESLTTYGNFSGLVLMWITGGWHDDGALEAAHHVLHGPESDPLRAKVHDLARRIETGEITWSQFAKMMKKGLIPRTKPKPSPPPADAVPLEAARATLAEMLANTSGSAGTPTASAAWGAFKSFAERPVGAAPPSYIEDDSCLFQWGISGSDRRQFEWDLVSQFVLHDGDGDYDHTEQLHLTLLFHANKRFAAVSTGHRWSGTSLDEWAQEVESLAAFTVATDPAAQPFAMAIEHEHVC